LDFSRNHFELFGLPIRYAIDTDLLADRYRALQHALHPDRFAAAGDREKRLSMQASVRVNEAFQLLKDPLERARYLLVLHTGDTDGENETTRDMAFLMEQMELRETLSEIKDQSDPTAAVSAVLDQLVDQTDNLVRQLESRLDDPEAEDLEEAQELVRKLQFVAKCRIEAENLEAELDDDL
jgi:molecular chaperone HscB